MRRIRRPSPEIHGLTAPRRLTLRPVSVETPLSIARESAALAADLATDPDIVDRLRAVVTALDIIAEELGQSDPNQLELNLEN